MLTGAVDGILSYLRALGVMGKFGLMRYFILSGIGGLIIGAIAGYLVYWGYDDIGNWIANLWPWEWGKNVVGYITDTLSVLGMILLFFFIYKYLIFILLAPLLSFVSQKVERKLTGDIHPSGMSWASEILRGLILTLRNILREILLTLVLLILSIILPWLAWLTAPMIFVVQAYYAGFGNMDYTLERYTSTSESIDFVKKHRGFAAGNGAIFLLLISIPVLGMFLAPFLGAVGASMGTLKRLQKV